MLMRVPGKLIGSVTCQNGIHTKLDHFCYRVKRRTRNFEKARSEASGGETLKGETLDVQPLSAKANHEIDYP